MIHRDRKVAHPAQPADRHQTIQDLIPLYATIAAQGNKPEDVYPAVAAHLADCATCRAELQELLDISQPAFAGSIPQAPVHRKADLSFLPLRPRPHAWQIDHLGRLVVSFSQNLLDSLRPATLAGAGRGQLLYRYLQEPETVPNLNTTIEVFASDQQPELASVRVHVELTDRDSFDQAGSTVVLHIADATWSDTVNDVGDAVFEAIPLDVISQLRVEITPPS